LRIFVIYRCGWVELAKNTRLHGFVAFSKSLSMDTKEIEMQTGSKIGQRIDESRRMSDMELKATSAEFFPSFSTQQQTPAP